MFTYDEIKSMEGKYQDSTDAETFKRIITLTKEGITLEKQMHDDKEECGFTLNPPKRKSFVDNKHPFLITDTLKYESRYTSDEIVSSKHRVISQEAVEGSLHEGISEAKRTRLSEDAMAHNRVGQPSGRFHDDYLKYVKKDSSHLKSIDIFKNKNRRFDKISRMLCNEILDPCVDASKDVVQTNINYDHLTDKNENMKLDGDKIKTKKSAANDHVPHNKAKSSSSIQDERCPNHSKGEKVIFKTASISFDTRRMSQYEDKFKATPIYFENNQEIDQSKTCLKTKKDTHTTDFTRDQTDIRPTPKIKEGDHLVLVKFRGKMQLIRRKDYNTLLSKLKSKSTIFTRKETSKSSTNIKKRIMGQKNGEFDSKVDIKIDKLWEPLDNKVSRNIRHSDMNRIEQEYIAPELRNMGQKYHDCFNTPLSQTELTFMEHSGGIEYDTENHCTGKMIAQDNTSIRSDRRHLRIDFEETRKQAQRLFRWHAERYFNKLESY